MLHQHSSALRDPIGIKGRLSGMQVPGASNGIRGGTRALRKRRSDAPRAAVQPVSDASLERLAPQLQAAEAAALATAAAVQVAMLLSSSSGQQRSMRVGGATQANSLSQEQRQLQYVQAEAVGQHRPFSAPPPAALSYLQNAALLVALSAGILLRRLHTQRATPGGTVTADAAVRLVRLEAAVQQQAEAASVSARQLDKLQLRARLASSDVKAPLRQLQEASAAQADAMGRLAEQQTRLQRQIEGVEEVITALQGVGARQFKVCVDALAAIKQEQAATAKEHAAALSKQRTQLALLERAVTQLRVQPGQAAVIQQHASTNGTGSRAAHSSTPPADPWKDA